MFPWITRFDLYPPILLFFIVTLSSCTANPTDPCNPEEPPMVFDSTTVFDPT